ncbi:MAG: SLC13 family permease [Chloroflexia bacterium]
MDARRIRPTVPYRRRFRWIVDATIPVALITTAGVGVLLPISLAAEARISLFAFSLAVILWSTTSINATYSALVSMMVLVLMGGASQDRLYDSLASDVVWLMIGAFVIGGAIQHTGLAVRLTQLIVTRARSVRGVFWLVTMLLIPLSFFIPSTSGRAAISIPIFQSITSAADDRRVTRALALLMPTVILVATVTSLIGAGSHLIANDLLNQVAKQKISFLEWMLYGLPFGIAASCVSCGVILFMFLDQPTRSRELHLPALTRRPLNRGERLTLVTVGTMTVLWITEELHGLGIATVTVAGGLLLMSPGFGVVSWKDGLKTISWNLVIFVGAALVLGEALIETGAAEWIIGQVFTVSGVGESESELLILLGLAFISLTSHVYMTSHSARVAALVPALLYLGMNLNLNPVAVMFIGTVGMDYCLTFPVSSKALLMFQEMEGETYHPSDLLRLSSVLLLVHVLLIVAAYYGYWRWIGLEL